MFAEFMVDKVDVVQVADSRDAAGGVVKVQTTVQTGVFCLLDKTGGDRTLVHDIENQVITYDVYFLVNYNMLTGWFIRPWPNASTAPNASSRTLRVLANTALEPWQDEVYAVRAEERT